MAPAEGSEVRGRTGTISSWLPRAPVRLNALNTCARSSGVAKCTTAVRTLRGSSTNNTLPCCDSMSFKSLHPVARAVAASPAATGAVTALFAATSDLITTRETCVP